MVERSYSLNMARTRATDLRTALYEHKEIIQQLQGELEAEREAAASSASEALDMILRLQIDKAKLAMEANQYKKMAEQQMSHAEISLAFLKDLIRQRELEINDLEYQVKAYRFKLLSSGCIDLPGYDDLTLKMNNLSLLCLHTGDCGGTIKKLDERVEEITVFRDSLRDKYKKLRQDSVTVSEKGEKGEDFASSRIVQDIFEVPKEEEKAKVAVKMASKQARDRACGGCSANEGENQAELKRLRERIERLEVERTSEVTETSGEKSSWKQIQKGFISVLSEIKNSISNHELPPRENPSLLTLQEAMLHFWF